MARNTNARRWAAALPVTVVAAVVGGIAVPAAAATSPSKASAQVAAAATEPAAAKAKVTAAAKNTTAEATSAAKPAKIAVRTLALGSAAAPAGGATASDAQPAGVPIQAAAAASASKLASVDSDAPRVLRAVTSGNEFSAVGVSYQRDASLGPVSVAVRTRTSASAPWSAWTTAGNGESDDRNGTNAIPLDVREGPGLIWTGAAKSAEVVVTSLSGRQPTDVKVDLIDPGATATDAAAASITADGDEVAQSDALTPANTQLPAPTTYGNGIVKIYSRAAWGANPAYMKWQPSYASKINAVVLHHTATSNDYQPGDVPGIIRSIYYYMAVTEKYGDVGYNVLIDRFGRVWEGRYGGINRAVIGAHAGGFNSGTAGIGMIGDQTKLAVTAAEKEAVARYAAFKLGTARVNPVDQAVSLTGGPSTKYKKRVTLKVPAIYPHQTTSLTACPGKFGLAILPWVRTRAKALATAYKLSPTALVAPVVSQPTVEPTTAPVKPNPTAIATSPAASAIKAAAAPAPGWTAVPATGLTVYGAGNGHGRGMSQYGAKGAANQGLSAAQILNFYYPGSTLAAGGSKTVRVRMSAIDGGHFTFQPVTGTTVSGIVATASNGARAVLSAQSGWHIARSGNSYLVQQPAGANQWVTKYTMAAPVTFTGPATLKVAYSKAKGDCRGGTTVTFNGSLTAVVSSNTAYYVANMALDTYLKGVVASEMPSSWPAAALQAQAVAARTYAASHVNTTKFYDVMDTQASQCWDGALSETAPTNAAIAATAGRVLTVSGKAISAEFSSDSGGYTASGGVSYLQAKADPYTLAAKSSATNWSKVFTPATLAAADGSAGLLNVTAIKVTGRSGLGLWGGRVDSVQLTGTAAGGKALTVTLTGTQLRVGLGLKSTYLGFTK